MGDTARRVKALVLGPGQLVVLGIRALIAVAEDPAIELPEDNAPRQNAFSIPRIKRFIAGNLRDPTRNLPNVAEEFGVSHHCLDESFNHESTTIY